MPASCASGKRRSAGGDERLGVAECGRIVVRLATSFGTSRGAPTPHASERCAFRRAAGPLGPVGEDGGVGGGLADAGTRRHGDAGSGECRVRSAECRMQSAECRVRSAECRVRSAECRTTGGPVTGPNGCGGRLGVARGPGRVGDRGFRSARANAPVARMLRSVAPAPLRRRPRPRERHGR